MDDTIADIGDTYLSPLIIRNSELSIFSVLICPILKVRNEMSNMLLQMIFENIQFFRPPLAAPEQKPAFPNNTFTYIYGRNSHHHQNI